MNIGIIAEESNDVEVLYEFTSKLIAENRFSFKKFVGHGCGKLRRKCTAWAENLMRRGCSHVVVLHDLDNNIEAKLREELTEKIRNVGLDGYIILIPIREIESWLLVDATALKNVFKMSKIPKLPSNPESVIQPKEKLRDIVWMEAKKRYVNAIHNRKIAAAIKISTMNKCRSFQSYPEFINTQLL